VATVELTDSLSHIAGLPFQTRMFVLLNHKFRGHYYSMHWLLSKLLNRAIPLLRPPTNHWFPLLLLPCLNATAADPLSNWHSLTLPAGTIIHGIAFGSNRFVAVGAFGVTLTSVDGINWLEVNEQAYARLFAVTYGPGGFVAVGEFGAVYNSPDGIQWTERASGVLYDLYGVCYGNGLYVAVGENATVMTSPDGVNWSSRSVGNVSLNGVTYGNNLFLAVGGESFLGLIRESLIITSPDGTNWTRRNSIVPYPLYSCAFGNGVFVAAGWYTLTSPDGITWTRSPAADGAYRVAFGDGTFVSVGNWLQMSIGGTNWTRQEVGDGFVGINPFLQPTFGIAHGNARFVAVGGGQRVMVRPGEQSYRLPSAPIPAPSDVVDGDGLLVAVGGALYSRRVVWTSRDGTVWGEHELGTDFSPAAVTYGNGVFVAVGGTPQNGILTSPDGTNWLAAESGTETVLHDVTFGLGRFVVVGDWGSVLLSQDARTWHAQNLAINSASNPVGFRSITYGNGVFVMVGTGILTSGDGTNWFQAEWPGGDLGDFRNITYGNGTFVISGYAVLSSRDGTNWVRQQNVPSYGFAPITFGHGRFVGLNDGGLWASSNAVDWTSYWLPFSSLFVAPSPRGTFISFSYDAGSGYGLFESDPLAPAAPVIVRHPVSLTVATGGTWSLKVDAIGSRPMLYQWFKDGMPLEHATNSLLELHDIQAGDTGEYAVLVTNASGSSRSDPAVVLVEPPLLRFSPPTRVRESSFSGCCVVTSSLLVVNGVLGNSWRIEYSSDSGSNWQSLSKIRLWQPSQRFVDLGQTNTIVLYRALLE
jgi:hypothetical protein